MRIDSRALGVSVVSLILVVFTVASADWPAPGVVVSTTPIDITLQSGGSPFVGDASGGAIVAWSDGRGSSMDVYARRLDPGGMSPWIPPESAISTATGNQGNVHLVSDGVGGACIAFGQATALTSFAVYAQRVTQTGQTAWQTNGKRLTASSAFLPELTGAVSDTEGGMIVVWEEFGSQDLELRAQRVDSSGSFQWATDGSIVHAWDVSGVDSTRSIEGPTVVSDGRAGVLAAWAEVWRDPVFGFPDSSQVHAQRVDANGVVQWSRRLESAPSGYLTSPQVLPVWEHSIVAWESPQGLHVQRLDQSGQTVWAIVEAAAGTQEILPDGSGGIITAWWDANRIMAQRISGEGQVLWSPGGTEVAVTNPLEGVEGMDASADNAGGVLIAWSQSAPAPPFQNVHVQKIDHYGSVQWPGGVVITPGSGIHQTPRILPIGGGGLVVWVGAYTSGGGQSLYAQRVNAAGAVVTDAPEAAGRDVVLYPSWPNPFNPTTSIGFDLPSPQWASLRVYDVFGRKVCTLMEGHQTSGFHSVLWDGCDEGGRTVASGTYFCVLSADEERHIRKMVLMK